VCARGGGGMVGLQFAIVMALSNMDFHDILMCDNLLYCAALFLELCAMVKLRVSQVFLSALIWDGCRVSGIRS